ncbi:MULTISPECIES: DUF29 domain-containing protein [Synechocystis]|uniref:DUF29 domain-containing protein n=1 Tax=Synechocystis salina LEGE 00031 TaxID=1828736 RepID=A0ABR9VVJ2_9SYNC|nr:MULTISPECIES: DUF29 domain-containing protein [Synechocystis]MBE9195629.1 DUF29 domain-containing protein [Synechocystis sp. LEGE 06083]MBE9242180.1 DUF29 domain-containing protein [Synechocystis salina LEGE 00041]MBE9255370.1 DUF29 domain-containing protein [Synechocystis salina LEGE 00031]
MVSQIETKTLYEQDFCLWAETMANFLKNRQLDQLDYENLIEEIEDMSGSQKDALESNLEVLLVHLLKWKYQPNKISNSWRRSIFEHRKRIFKAFRKSPSLKRHFEQVLDEVYDDARKSASVETRLPLKNFPESNPFTKEEILNEVYPSDLIPG